jgi:dTDP-4-dehydrorhamnose 3,5-epimerase
MPFTFSRLRIPEVVLVENKAFPDARGSFAELFKSSDFKKNGAAMNVVQVNQSRSRKNVLRGLHYQLSPEAQAKLVTVLKGEIFDVAVDIRKGSPTFGKWVGERLSEVNRHSMFIPEGFAHGFCVLSDEAEVIYSCSADYSSRLERSIIWNDPRINIAWPITAPLVSPKDLEGKTLDEAENNFEYGSS